MNLYAYTLKITNHAHEWNLHVGKEVERAEASDLSEEDVMSRHEMVMI